MKIYIPWLSAILVLIILSSCRNDNATPIRNVRFDPGLLNPVRAADAPCTFYNYYTNAQSKALGAVYSKMVLVSFAEGYTHEQALATAGGYGFVEKLGQAVESNSARLYPVQLVDGLNCKQVEQAIRELEKDAGIAYAAPYFLATDNGNAQLLGLTNEFRVTIGEGKEAGMLLTRLANATNTTIVAAVSEDTYLLKTDKNSRGNALQMANHFKEQAIVAHAEPKFVVSPEM
ncbi:hypothetical protein [Pontibacter roseus]|uniref:hypothetical protein n=1 Tax=Pontibacter roseus TaxID=336989 RepID=UPI00039D31FE|nr:hypothetical protein [Pontibacter roseus]